MSEQCIILLRQRLFTQGLLKEEPEVVDALILLCELRVSNCLLVVCLELGEQREVETTSLLVHERRLHQEGVGTFLQNVLKFLVGNCQTQLLGLSLNKLVIYIRVPNLIVELVLLLGRQVVTSLCHLDNIRVLFYEFLEVLN